MSETIQIWLFGVTGAWLMIVTGGCFRMWTLLTQVQTILILTSQEAAKTLHSPDDHLGIDTLLEKYINTIDFLHGKYVDREYELTPEEWGQLRTACEAVIASDHATKQEKLAATLVRWPMDLAKHKLKAFQP